MTVPAKLDIALRTVFAVAINALEVVMKPMPLTTAQRANILNTTVLALINVLRIHCR